MHTLIRVCFAMLCARSFALLGILFCALILTGCDTLDRPSLAQTSAIKSGQKSIVLFRSTESVTNNGNAGITGSQFYDRHLARLDGSEIACSQIFDIAYTSIKTPKQPGWQYFILDPGDYFFQQHLSLGYTMNFTNPPVVFHVPTNTPMIYIGSLRYGLEKLPKRDFWTSFFAGHVPDYRLHNLGLADESSEAAQIASLSVLQEFGQPVTSLAALYDDKPVVFAALTNRHITKVEVSNPSAFKTDDVGSYAAGWTAAPFLVAGTGVINDASHKPDNTPKQVRHKVEQDFVGAAIIIAGLPFIIAADKTIGDAARKQWAPYQAALEKVYSEFGLSQHLTTAIGNQLATLRPDRTNTTNSTDPVACTLRVEPYRILLREMSRGQYYLEVAVLVQLVDESSKSILWQHDYAYTDDEDIVTVVNEDDDGNETQYSFGPVEAMIPVKTPPRKLDEYKGEGGVKLFQEDLTTAVNNLAENISARLKQAGLVFDPPRPPGPPAN